MNDNGTDAPKPGRRRKPAAEPLPPVVDEAPAPSKYSDDDEGKKRTGLKAILSLLAIGALIVGGFFAVEKLDELFNGPGDYDGRGSGEVIVKISPGDDGVAISRTLEKAGVVKTAEAFYQVVLRDSRAQSIQPGSYRLRKQMRASLALEALLDPTMKVQAKFTVPEGSRVGQIVKIIAKSTDISEADLEKALDDPKSFGLPAEAEGNPEGWLFAATYEVEPGDKAVDVLKRMVDKTQKVAKELNLKERAARHGLTEHEILTLASIVEREGRRDDDFPKIARVIHNRIAEGMPLQMDSTVHYVSEREGDVWTTPEERANPSEYNTYQHVGLPPGPIGAPGRKTIEAALEPTYGPWLYFVTVDTKTGETVFSTTYAEHVAACKKAYGPGAAC